ncbi:hypothetical protein LQW54_001088 [Pestalotiopsis sp. IQ-011]
MRPTRLLAVGLYTSHGALAILPAVLPALSAAGFTPAGIAAGSIAAGVQSTIGNVAAGSLFATLQSAGMGGYGVTVLHAAAQAGAAEESPAAAAICEVAVRSVLEDTFSRGEDTFDMVEVLYEVVERLRPYESFWEAKREELDQKVWELVTEAGGRGSRDRRASVLFKEEGERSLEDL